MGKPKVHKYLPLYIQQMEHSHDTPIGQYVDGCHRCAIEKELMARRLAVARGQMSFDEDTERIEL